MVGGFRSVKLPARTVFSVRAAFAFGILLLLLWSLASQPLPTASAAGGVTYTVNSIADPGDGVCTAADCTLREAILAANAAPGRDTIVFAFSGTPPFTIRPTSALPVITDPIVIDGLSLDRRPPRTRPVVELDGSLAGPDASGLVLQTSDSVVNGLIINRFAQNGILIDGGSDFTITGNLIGTDTTGTVGRGNGGNGIDADGATAFRIGGTVAAARNVVSGNFGSGVRCFGGGNVTIQGNYIGTDASGLRAIPNGLTKDSEYYPPGVSVLISVSPVIIGGLEPGAGNVISGNRGTGVRVVLFDPSVQTVIAGNLIGLTVDGSSPLGNRGYGAEFKTVAPLSVFGPGNIVAFNLGGGLKMDDLAPVGARGNSFFGNGWLGIERANFDGFRHVGPPQLQQVSEEGATATVSGWTGQGSTDTEFLLDFYASPSANRSGYGEGKALVGTTTLRTDASGRAEFSVSLPAAALDGHFVTATLSHPDFGTSEFSIALPVGDAPCQDTLTFEGNTVAVDHTGVLWVSRFNRAGPFMDIPRSSLISPDGSTLFIAGRSYSESARDIDGTVLALSTATGRQLWVAHFDGPAHQDDNANALAVSPDGSRLFVAARFRSETGVRVYVVIAYDARTGEVVWQTVSAPAGAGTDGGAAAIALSPDGHQVIVTGDRSSLGTLALDASTGEEVWAIDLSGNHIQVQSRPEGPRAYISTLADPASGGGLGLVTALDLTDGSTVWQVSMDVQLGALLLDTRFDQVVVAGSASATTPRPFTAALAAADGTIRWATTFVGQDAAPGPAMDVMPVGATSLSVLARETADQGPAILTLTYDARDGRQLVPGHTTGESDRLNEPIARAAVAGGGTAVLAWSYPTYSEEVLPGALSGYDFATFVGTVFVPILARYDGPIHGEDFPVALAAGPDQRSSPLGGRLYVTGYSRGCGTEYDIVTIAYQFCAGYFTDVPCGHWAVRAIENAFAQDLLRGFGDGTYRPDQFVSRAQGAVLLARAADRIEGDLEAFTPPACGSESFTDFPCDHFAYRFVEYLVSKFVVAVPASRLFNSNGTLDRGAQAAYAALVIHLRDADLFAFTPPPCGSESFTDVPCSLGNIYPLVEYLRAKGVTSGFGDGTYRPFAAVTRAQMAVFLLRTLNIAP